HVPNKGRPCSAFEHLAPGWRRGQQSALGWPNAARLREKIGSSGETNGATPCSSGKSTTTRPRGGTLTRPPEPTTFCTSSTCPIWRSRKKDGAASAAPETPTTARDV